MKTTYSKLNLRFKSPLWVHRHDGVHHLVLDEVNSAPKHLLRIAPVDVHDVVGVHAEFSWAELKRISYRIIRRIYGVFVRQPYTLYTLIAHFRTCPHTPKLAFIELREQPLQQPLNHSHRTRAHPTTATTDLRGRTMDALRLTHQLRLS